MIETICLEFRSILFGARGLANKHGFKDACPKKKTNNGKVANFQADSADFYFHISNSNSGANKNTGKSLHANQRFCIVVLYLTGADCATVVDDLAHVC